MARLAAKGLSVTLGGRQLLRDVNLELDGGEVVGLLGPSGAGKSTLFRALVGEERPEAGGVFFEGTDVTTEPLWKRARRGLGYVPQTPSVLWELTVSENLSTFVRFARDHSRGRSPPAASELASRLELGGHGSVVAGRLSGGERRRLELARALSMAPSVLVCDEPFAGVDPKGAAHLGAILRGLGEAGVAVILADHHVAEALAVCTRAILLLDGAIVTEGTPAAFVEHPLVKGRYLGTLASVADRG